MLARLRRLPRASRRRAHRRRGASALRAGALVAFLAATLLAACDTPEETTGAVHILRADMIVGGVMERYIDRGIAHAEETGATAVVLLIDTPGGEIGAMKRIAGRIERAEVPVVTYVAPAGAQAASAGTFITMAGHVAAMAPNTTIGAASPVDAAGGDIEGTMGRKVEEDTAAFARGVAELRDRNVEWADQAVREAVSASGSEAVNLNVVDLLAPNLQSLLQQIDGREVELLDGTVASLAVVDAPQVENFANAYERVLEIVSNPVVVSLLFLLAIVGIGAEIFAPGTFVPGTVGVIALLLVFLGVGTLLPAEAAIALFILAGILVGAEFFIASGGVLGAGGAVAAVLGLFILLGQASTELSFGRILLYIAVFVGAVSLLIIAAFVLIAKDYIAGSQRSGGSLH